MKTHAEFEDDVRSLARTVANEYADEMGIEFDISDPEEPENDLATLTNHERKPLPLGMG